MEKAIAVASVQFIDSLFNKTKKAKPKTKINPHSENDEGIKTAQHVDAATFLFRSISRVFNLFIYQIAYIEIYHHII